MDSTGAQSKGLRKVSNKKKKGIKVVYISTPMKVKTSASKFRALVQELTGRDSDTARLMMEDGINYNDRDQVAMPAVSCSEESNCAQEESGNYVVFKEQEQPWEESFEGQMFPFSSLVNDNQYCNYSYYDQLDVFRSFDAATVGL